MYVRVKRPPHKTLPYSSRSTLRWLLYKNHFLALPYADLSDEACLWDLISWALYRRGRMPFVRYCLRWGPVNRVWNSMAPLGRAASGNNLRAVEWLLDRGAWIDMAGHGYTNAYPITIAAKRGYVELVKLLQERGSVAVSKALCVSMLHGQSEVFLYFYHAGIRLHPMYKTVPPCMCTEAQQAHHHYELVPRCQQSPMGRASKYKNMRMLLALLTAFGLKNHRDLRLAGCNLLCWATTDVFCWTTTAQANHFLRALLEAGADPTLRCKLHHKTPLEQIQGAARLHTQLNISIRQRWLDCHEYLLEVLADPGLSTTPLAPIDGPMGPPLIVPTD